MLRAGDHLVSSSWIYGGTRRLFAEELTRLGMEVTFVDTTIRETFESSYELARHVRSVG